jgi:hypothetical protein
MADDIHGMRAKFIRAADANDVEAMRSIVNDPAWSKGVFDDAWLRAKEMKATAKSGKISPTLVLAVALANSDEADAILALHKARLAQLESRIATIEQQRESIAYAGTYRPGEKYAAGTFITDHGSLWHANRSTTQRPGTSDDWTLAVKKGAR